MSDVPTVKAVVKYAEKLRADAQRAIAANPYAKPYYPTTAGARQRVKRAANRLEAEVRAEMHGRPAAEVDEAVAQARAHAPQVAIDELRARAAGVASQQRDADRESKRSLERHQRRQAQAARDLSAARAGLTLGQRLDAALAELAVVSAAPVAQLDSDRVKGGERSQNPPWSGDPEGYARTRAHDLVQHVEGLLDSARVRDVQKAAA